ncbi:MAG TPA: acyltransferase [Clostridia bacterium]|nr:acyltransferase [Clostridia bacterium]
MSNRLLAWERVRSKSNGAEGRFPEVDGLRAIAVSLVLLDHFFSYAVPLEFIRRVTGFGWVGVDLFFVISGFLIGGILLGQREATNYYRIFYTRRFFRIIPLYLVVLAPALLIVTLGLQKHLEGHSLGNQSGWVMLLYLCFMQNLGGGFLFVTPNYLGAMWSLAVEEQFYLLLPPVVRRWQAGRLLKVIVIAIVAAPLLRVTLFLLLPNDPLRAGMASYGLLPCRWDSLLLGVLIAYVVRTPWMLARLEMRTGQLRAAWVILALGMIAMTLSGFKKHHPLIATVGYTWIAGFFTLTLLVARLNPSGCFFRWLSSPLLRPVATVSYGLYLLQGPMLALKELVVRRLGFVEVGWSLTAMNVIALAATGLAATISWKFFESHLVRIGHRNSYLKPAREHVTQELSEATTTR